MLEIKTIIGFIDKTEEFDEKVNTALADGWDLVKRDMPVAGVDHIPFYYAELERIVEEPEEDDDYDMPAHWITTRNPSKPLRCSNCGYEETTPKPVCPNCIKVMEDC